MDLALKFRAEFLPVALHNVAEIVIVAPVFSDLVVNFACALVPDALGVAIFAIRGIDGFPDIPLLARACLVTEDKFPAILHFDRVGNMSEIVALARLVDLAERAFIIKGVVFLINVGDHHLAEVDRIRAGCEGAIVLIRIFHLNCQSFPAAGRAAIDEA